jgi:cytochrome P450
MTCVIKETQRLYPSSPFLGRTMKKDDIICGYDVPNGRHILLSPWLMHRNPRYWSDPDSFIPERFLETESDPFYYVPFSVGPRNCVGFKFALYEMKVILARFLKDYKVETVSDQPAEIDKQSFTLAPANLTIKFVRRHL